MEEFIEPTDLVKITTNITIEQREWLRRAAFEERKSRSAILREMIDEKMERKSAKNA